MLATATLILTVTLALPGIGPRTAELEFPMPDMAECERKGRALAADSDGTRRFEFMCRRST